MNPQGPGPLAARFDRRHAWFLAAVTPACLGPAWVRSVGASGPWQAAGTWAGLVLTLLVLTCSVTDLLWKRVPNWATYTASLWAVAINGLSTLGGVDGLGAVGLADCLLGAAACFGLMLAVYRLASGGAGDVKLATAVGALLGVEKGVLALAYTYVVAGVVLLAMSLWVLGPVALITMVARKAGAWLLPGLVGPPSREQERFLQAPVPMAVFFAAGALAALTGRV